MRPLKHIILLTLVVCTGVAIGAPQRYSPEPKYQQAKEESKNSRIDKNNLIVTKPIETPELKKEKKKRIYYPYLSSMSPRIGGLFEALSFSNKSDDESDQSQIFILGVQYMAPKFRPPQFEFTADILSDSTGHVAVAKRWIFFERSGFRPFYKAGVVHRIVPSEQLASFTNYKNYFLHGAVGFEKLLVPPMSIRLDTELSVGITAVWLSAILGYSWAW